MGIDTHVLKFLRNAHRKKNFGDSITVGRQGLSVDEAVVKKIIGAKASYRNKTYCEELLLEYFGASVVESIDNSGFEGATYIHNMNDPLPPKFCDKFDTVIDAGCLEHIYNVPQALKNCSLLCKRGGQILHVLPANNFCGHGFWQFSPELFFSLYSKENGYEETEVFLADLTDIEIWYQVKEPRHGRRVNVNSSRELYILVRTIRKDSPFTHSDVQQSDYVHEWESSRASLDNETLPVAGMGKPKKSVRKLLKSIPLFYEMLSPMYHYYLRAKSQSRLNKKNPSLTAVVIDA